MINDKYKNIAENYDRKRSNNNNREYFFVEILEKYEVSSLLDCACGTGRDLLMFHSMGIEVSGSDLSESMLQKASDNVNQNNIYLKKVDFLKLSENFNRKFDAVVCLNSSINELLEDEEVIIAIRNMKEVLNPNGIIIFDQGQTDCSMLNPPEFVSVIDESNFSRVVKIKYTKSTQVIEIFDLFHEDENTEFNYSIINIRIRLLNRWKYILNKVGFSKVTFYGNWNFSLYDKESSQKLICVVQK